MSYQIEFRHFKYFLALAEDLHFRKASERLFISQPGLSKQIKQMEESLGFDLFERHNRKVKLTKAGEFMQKELTDHFAHLKDIIARARLLHAGMEGNLKLGYVGSAMQKAIPDLLLRFGKQYPNVLFNINEMDNNEQIKALLKQEIDLGFVRLERVPKDLNITPLFEDTFSLVLPENHKINSSNFESLLQLKDEAFILFDASYSQSYYEKLMQIFDDACFSPIISHSTVNASSIFRLVESHFGVSIVPSSLSLGYNMKIKFIELAKIPQRTTLKLVWNRVNTNPILHNFLKTVE